MEGRSWLYGLVAWLLTVPIVLSADELGVSLGSLTTKAHQVAADVYVVDDSRIRLVHFTYDGQGPDAFFYIGIRNETSSTPAPDGIIIPDEQGRADVLSSYSDDDITLTLPTGVSVTDVLWISVWCRRFSANFGDLVFPANFDVPAPVNIGSFSTLAHNVKSGNVIVQDSKTFYIPDFYYDGAGPDAFLLVGTGNAPHDGGTKVPDELGSLEKLKGYSGQSITITLPGDLTVHDIDWISVYCITYRHDFGNIILPSALQVPPYMESTTNMEPMANCVHLHDYLNVDWEVMGDHVVFEMTGALETDGGYMAFGLSGSNSASSMIGADVFVAYYDEAEASYEVDDYKLTAYSMCSAAGEGACTDESRSGDNDLSLISASRNGGITKVRFMRLLETADIDNDINITTSGSMYVVWAMGKLTSSSPYIVTKHNLRLTGNKQLEFGGASSSGCDRVMPRTEVTVDPWETQMINGRDTKEFRVKIGPAGGNKGYSAITGKQSWGIAYYVNELLIPELYLKRNDTYTFIIEAGDDPNRSAKYHPFYITDDSIGGYSKKTNADKQSVMNYAGVKNDSTPADGAVGRYCEYEHQTTDQADNSATFENYFQTLRLNCVDGSAGTLTWTPQSDTPDLLYYQCLEHNYLGWKIHIVDEYPASGATLVTSYLTCLMAAFIVATWLAL